MCMYVYTVGQDDGNHGNVSDFTEFHEGSDLLLFPQHFLYYIPLSFSHGINANVIQINKTIFPLKQYVNATILDWKCYTTTILTKDVCVYVCKCVLFSHHNLTLYLSLNLCIHYNDVRMRTMASQITSLTIVYSTVYSGAHQIKYQSSASLAFVWGIHRWPVNSPHKWPVTRKIFPFDDVIMLDP